MRFKVIMSVAVLVLSSFVTLSSANALTPDATEVVNIPFNFYAAGKKMPAGKYTVLIDLENERIILTDSHGPSVFVTGIYGGDGYDQSQLVFAESGGTYALQEVKSDLADMVFAIDVPKATMASRTVTPKVQVAMNHS